MEKNKLIYLFLVVVLGAILRISYLTYSPPSLNWDEVSHGYNAYSILKTGMDEWGQKFPIINFRAYGDYPTPLNLYLTIPSVAIFGLNEFAIRLPQVVLGILTIISVYFLVLGVTKRTDIALLSAFLTATGPWYVFTSRFVLQSNLSVFFLITAMAFFFNRENNKYAFNLSIVSLFLTLFSYHTTRIFSPLLLVALTVTYWPEMSKKLLWIFLFFVSTFVILINPVARARSNVLFVVDSGAVSEIEALRNQSKLPVVVKKIIYNRPNYFLIQFSKNYVSYFSPEFLFLKGGTQFQFSIPNTGLIYIIAFPFFYIGLFFLVLRSKTNKDFRFILFWLLLYPIPASLTTEHFAVIRATTFLPIPELLISMGFYFFLDKFKKQETIIFTLFCVGILISADNYLTNYFTSYRTNYSWSWQYGYKEVVSFVKNKYSDYDKIIITKKYGEPHEFVLFYMAWDPGKFRNDSNLNRFYQSGWYWVDGFDKFYFVNDWDIAKYSNKFVLESKREVECDRTRERCLLITSPGNMPLNWRKISTINFLDDKEAFEIYDNK